jgi:hypothetical protein
VVQSAEQWNGGDARPRILNAFTWNRNPLTNSLVRSPFPELPAALLGTAWKPPVRIASLGQGLDQAGIDAAKLPESKTISVRTEGIETSQDVEFTSLSGDSRQLDPTRVDVSARELVAFGPEKSTVESALARAIEGAVSPGAGMSSPSSPRSLRREDSPRQA